MRGSRMQPEHHPRSLPGKAAGLTRRRLLAQAGASLLSLAAPSAVRAAPVLSRGINIPGWFDRPDGIAPVPVVLEKLRGCGFDTVRLPIDGDVVLSGPRLLRAVRQGIETLLEAGFTALADLHPSARLHAALRADPLAGGDRAADAWTALSAALADLPAEKVQAELLNEPPMTTAAWLALRQRLAEIVRRACPRHTLVWGPALDQGLWRLAETPPLADDRQVAAVHFYAPMAFTHQCQSWGASPLARLGGLPFPATKTMPRLREKIAALRAAGDEAAADLLAGELATDWTPAAIRTAFRRAADWSAATGCPLMLNEFGVLDVCVDPASRRAWVRAVRRAAQENGIGWAYWELDQGFGLIADRRRTDGFDDGMLDALFGTGG